MTHEWDIPESWNDATRWVPTLGGGPLSHHDYGRQSGDLAGRLVAVSNGRWFALPFLRAGEKPQFVEGLITFAIKYGIRLTVWRHPLTDLSGCAELIASTVPAPYSERIAA